VCAYIGILYQPRTKSTIIFRQTKQCIFVNDNNNNNNKDFI